MSNRLLEVCCADAQSVLAAIAGGADRIELCSALELDGLTPSAALVEWACSTAPIPVHVLIRPRPGDFVYDETEIGIMLADIEYARQKGAAGVVIGALTPDSQIDEAATARMVAAAKGLNVTYHRAFDVCANPEASLEKIIALGCNRILTSGQATSAIQGVEMLRKLNQQANGRITLLAGAGINTENAAKVLEEAGLNEVHGSCRKDGATNSDVIRTIKKSI